MVGSIYKPYIYLIRIQSISHSVVSDSATPWTVACQASLPSTISWSLIKLMSIKSMMPPNLSHPLLPSSLPALNLSQHQCLFQ